MEDIVREAKKRVNEKKGFYWHMFIFVITMLFIIVMNLTLTPHFWWFLFALGGWGIGILIHYVVVFGIPGSKVLSRNWEKQQLEKEILQIRDRRQMLLAELEDDVLNLNEKDYEKRALWDKRELEK